MKDGYEIIFNMKGLDQEKVDIEINEHSITVKGEHSRQEKEEGQGTFYSSSSFGSFMKTIPLPVDADTSKVKTEKKGDSLVIRLPKKNT
jgi:HSP20 family protein